MTKLEFMIELFKIHIKSIQDQFLDVFPSRKDLRSMLSDMLDGCRREPGLMLFGLLHVPSFILSFILIVAPLAVSLVALRASFAIVHAVLLPFLCLGAKICDILSKKKGSEPVENKPLLEKVMDMPEPEYVVPASTPVSRVSELKLVSSGFQPGFFATGPANTNGYDAQTRHLKGSLNS